MIITKHIIQNDENGIKIEFETYHQGSGRKINWYGEYTKEDYEKGLGWNQWGASAEYLSNTVDTVEEYTEAWIEEFSKIEEDSNE